MTIKRNFKENISDDMLEHIKLLRRLNKYQDYLDIIERYSEDFKTDFIDIETFIKNHNKNKPCDIIINEEGNVIYALPSHDIAILLAYHRMNEDEYYLACCDLLEYTNYIKVYEDYIYMPSSISISQFNSIIRLVGSKCINYDYTRIRHKIKNNY